MRAIESEFPERASESGSLNFLDVYAHSESSTEKAIQFCSTGDTEERVEDKEKKSNSSDTENGLKPLWLLGRKLEVGASTLEFLRTSTSGRFVSRIGRTDNTKTNLQVDRSWIDGSIRGVYEVADNTTRRTCYSFDEKRRVFLKHVDGKPTDEIGLLRISNRGVLTFDNLTTKQRETTDYSAAKVVTEKRELKSAFSRVSKGELASCAEKMFDDIDKDRSKYITRIELAAALESHKYTGKEAGVLAALYKGYSSLSTARGITRESLREFEKLDKQSENQLYEYQKLRVKEVYKIVDLIAANQLERTGGLYEDTRKPLLSIEPEAVRQGVGSNGHFLAVVAAIANSAPELIEKMIKDNKNGTFTVTFPAAPNEPITVNRPTEAEAGLFNHTSHHGVWVNVLEKAYGKYCQKSMLRRAVWNVSGGLTPAEGAQSLLSVGPELKLLTDKSYVRAHSTQGEEKIQEVLKECFKHPKVPVICETFDIGGITRDGFRAPRAFTVIAFDPDSGDGGTLTLRSPIGGEEGSPDGRLRISLATFRRNFGSLYYVKK